MVRSTKSAKSRSESESDPLLDAAVELIRRGGVAALSTETLAGEAKVSKTTIYKRFTGKIDVLAATLDHLDWRPAVSDVGDLAAELVEYHRDRSRFFAQPGVRGVLAAVMSAAAGDDATRRAVANHVRRQLGVPRDIFKRARARGELRGRPTDDTLVTVLCGAAYYRAVIEGRRLDQDFLDELVELVTGATERP